MLSEALARCRVTADSGPGLALDMSESPMAGADPDPVVLHVWIAGIPLVKAGAGWEGLGGGRGMGWYSKNEINKQLSS